MSEIKKKRNRYINKEVKYYLARLSNKLYSALQEQSKIEGIAVNKLIVIASNEYLKKAEQEQIK